MSSNIAKLQSIISEGLPVVPDCDLLVKMSQDPIELGTCYVYPLNYGDKAVQLLRGHARPSTEFEEVVADKTRIYTSLEGSFLVRVDGRGYICDPTKPVYIKKGSSYSVLFPEYVYYVEVILSE